MTRFSKLLTVVAILLWTAPVSKSALTEEIVSAWEQTLNQATPASIGSILQDAKHDWPEIVGVATKAETFLRARSVAVACQALEMIRTRLSDRSFHSADKLLGTAKVCSHLASKASASGGIVNIQIVESLERTAILCIARAVLLDAKQRSMGNQLWSEMLDQKKPCAASEFLLRLRADDPLISDQESAIKDLPSTSNYIEALFVIGERFPEQNEAMAKSVAWKQLLETGKTQVLLRVTFPAFFDFMENNGDWNALTDANADPLDAVLSRSSTSKYSFPLMQVRRAVPSEVRKLYDIVSTDDQFTRVALDTLIVINAEK